MSQKESQSTLDGKNSIPLDDLNIRKSHEKIVFKPYSQNQDFLLPKRLIDFINPSHIAFLISQIIDSMDLTFVIETYKGGGTSSYEPRMLLKVWILGFVNRVYSCRLLAKSLRESLPFIWISGNQTPDFHTLNNFRLRLKDDIKKIFKHIVVYALKSGLIEGKDVFVDHSKITANANKHKMVWRKQVEKQLVRIDAELDELFSYIDDLNEQENRSFHEKDLPEMDREGFEKEKVQDLIDKINLDFKQDKINRDTAREERKKVRRTKELLDSKQQYQEKKKILGKRNSYSKTDNDAVAMMMKDKLTIRPGYNEGIAVENGLVLNYIVSDNCADNVSFIPLMEGVIDNLDKTPENTDADSAYGNEENHVFLEKKGSNNFLKYNLYHKEKSNAWKTKKIRLQDFTYDKDNNEFICPNKNKLVFITNKEEITKTGYKRIISSYQCKEGTCKYCRLKKKCLSQKNSTNTRTLQLSWLAQRLKEQAKNNLDSEKGKELRKRRANEVESIFGDEKLNKLKRRYHLRGLKKVSLEAGVYYISHNLRRIHKLFNKKYQEKQEFKLKIRENPKNMIFTFLEALNLRGYVTF